MARYFGTDGFRGCAGDTINSEQAFKIGRFLGWYYTAKGGRCRVVIGKDTRLSSYTLEYAIAAGITASGGDAYILHVTTTPSVSFVTRAEGFDCGVMISASHNTYLDNGIKLVNSRGEKMERGVLNLIEDYIDGRLFIGGEPFSIPFARGEKIGKTVDFVAGRNRYTGHLISLSTCSYKGLKVGLDCANGSSYKIARSVFDALGASVYEIGGEPNGLNVNEGCGATRPQVLSRLVKDNALDVGFAFDGDADRCICVDERGKIIDGDGILYASARFLKDKGELLGDRIVATVMSNGGLREGLAAEGIAIEECAVGDSYVYRKMNESGAVLGGEQSGHIIYGKLENTGDGLVTAIMIMEAMNERGTSLSGLVRGFKKKPQLTVNVSVKNKSAAVASPAVAAAVAGAERRLKGRGRLLVRPSGTEDLVRVTVESATADECDEVCREIERALKMSEGEA
ncbi:MAG: phosphoglucosamine mutase [Clostridiales bacterium]|nr:phosphoglucosamine mutase [Clostridiales bacterium]